MCASNIISQRKRELCRRKIAFGTSREKLRCLFVACACVVWKISTLLDAVGGEDIKKNKKEKEGNKVKEFLKEEMKNM